MKIKSISNLTMFEKDQEIDLSKKLTLIFGYNGSGKTSISRLLNYISDKQIANFDFGNLKSLNSDENLKYEIIDDNEMIVPNISAVVFNKDFIDSVIKKPSFIENKISSDRVTVADITFKEKEVFETLSTELDEVNRIYNETKLRLDNLINSELQEQKQSIFSANIKSFNLEKFLSQYESLPQTFDLDTEKELRNRIEGFSKIDEDSKVDEFRTINLDNLNEIANLIGFEEEELVLKYLNDLSGEHRSWVLSGVDHINSDLCPFCRASIQGNDILVEYRKFRESNVSLTLDSLRKNYDDYTSNVLEAINNIEKVKLTFFRYKDVISQFDNQLSKITFLEADINSMIILVKDIVFRKITSPYQRIDQKIEILDSKNKVLESVSSLQNTIKSINRSLANSVSESRKSKHEYIEKVIFPRIKTLIQKDYEDVKNNENHLVILKPKYEEAKRIYHEELAKRDAVIRQVNGVFDSIGFEKYRIDTAFRLYHRISSKDVDLSFTEKLSDGEKSLVAFALFYSQIKLNVYESVKIIVIDDPVSSLDYENIYNIHFLIEDLIKNTQDKKFVILTHNHLFQNCLLYRRSSQSISDRNFQSYRIIRDENNISHIKVDTSKSVSIYIDKLERINKICSEGQYFEFEVSLIPNFCRYLLETVALFIFPYSGDPVISLIDEIDHKNKDLIKQQQSAIISNRTLNILSQLVNKGSHATLENSLDGERYSENDYKLMCKGTIQIIQHYAPHQIV